MSDNAEQIEFWNGATAINWVATEERMDQLLAPLSAHVIDRAAVQSGDTVLDVGCGCGGTSLAMAALGAEVLGIDVSQPMLARAKEHGQGNDRVEFIQADASTHEFDRQFDLLFSRFGVMFFADPVAAFANLRDALKPTGHACFICWQAMTENSWLAIPTAAVQPFLPKPEAGAEAPDPRAPGPFSFADADYLRQILTDAGFTEIAIEAHPVEMQVGTNLDEAMEFYTRIGPLSGVLETLDPADRDAARAAIEQVLVGRQTATGIALPGGCWIVTAQR